MHISRYYKLVYIFSYISEYLFLVIRQRRNDVINNIIITILNIFRVRNYDVTVVNLE